MSETRLENFVPDQGSIHFDGGWLRCSWENSHLLEDYDFSFVQQWIISSASSRACDIQGYRLLKNWLSTVEYSILSNGKAPELTDSKKSKHHRHIENAALVAAELISNARKSSREDGEPNAPVEFAYCATPEGIFISVKDFKGEFNPASFLPALKLGLKKPQVENSDQGAGLGLFLILSYSSVVLVKSVSKESSLISVFIPARSNGTKLFYFKQEE